MTDQRRTEGEARPQGESNKVHGDKLDPMIPRGADQRDAEPDPAGGEPRKREENDLTGDRGTGAR